VLPIVPNRGLIVDRNGVVLATNYSAYTLEITPSRASTSSTPPSTAGRGGRDRPRDRKRFKRLLDEGKSFESLPIRTKLSDEEVARFTAQRFRFPGVEVKARLFRSYPLGEVGSHLLGYIGRINQAEKRKAMEDWPDEELANYRGTEYIGKLGLEQATRRELHGTDRLRAGGDQRRRPGRAPPEPASRPTPGNTWCCRSTSGCRRWSSSCSATAAARWWRSIRATARCWPSSASPPSTPTCSSTASTRRAGSELNESIDKPLLNRALRGTYPPGRPTSPSWRWRR
jgi:penicillin-binding protein 2